MRRDQAGVIEAEYLDVEILQLHDMVLRAPGMGVTRANLKSGAAIELHRRVQIVHGMNDMIEAAWMVRF